VWDVFVLHPPPRSLPSGSERGGGLRGKEKEQEGRAVFSGQRETPSGKPMASLKQMALQNKDGLDSLGRFDSNHCDFAHASPKLTSLGGT
jgi:hypothetical protein